jgi:glutamate 5-kinase
VGIIEVEGTFHEHECVTVKAGHRTKGTGLLDRSKPLENIGKARVNYASTEIDQIKGLQSHQIDDVLGYADSEYVAHRDNLAFPPVVLERTQSTIELALKNGIKLD